MQINKKYNKIIVLVFIIGSILILGVKSLDNYIQSVLEKRIEKYGWKIKIGNSSRNLLSTTVYEDIILSNISGSEVSIGKVSVNLNLLSFIIGNPSINFLSIEGIDAFYSKGETIAKKTENVNNFLKVPFHIKSFFIDGRLTSYFNEEQYSLNIIASGRLKGLKNPVIKFDLLKIFLENDININCDFNQILIGHDGSSFFM